MSRIWDFTEESEVSLEQLICRQYLKVLKQNLLHFRDEGNGPWVESQNLLENL